MMEWCEHIKFYKGDSGVPYFVHELNKASYINKWLLRTPIRKGTFIMKNWMMYCPICGKKRPIKEPK